MNRLAGSTSPYLRQHADNPVDWWPWIPEAFEDAKRRNVPVHLSIGYAACHWCHVMARESFSDPTTAEVLNQNFVSIKVDREERPEVDQIYMRALHALGEQGGWPLTMFLTPDAEPFWGGTYFPPEPRYGRPSFRQVLGAVSGAWTSGDAAITTNASQLREHLNRPVAPPAGSLDPAILDAASKTILSIWDPVRGSFNGAPKFPNPVVQEVLWRAYRRTGNTDYRDAVVNTLTYLCQGGIYDHVGGGFARYSVDAEWLVPHFEKMLYDNGQLLSLLSYAYHETKTAIVSEANRRDGRLARSRDAAPGRRLCLEPRRRHRARGGADLRLVVEMSCRRCSAQTSQTLRARLRRHARGQLGRHDHPEPTRAGVPRMVRRGERGAELQQLREIVSLAGATNALSPAVTTRFWRTGTGWRSPASHMPRA